MINIQKDGLLTVNSITSSMEDSRLIYLVIFIDRFIDYIVKIF